MQTLEPGLIRSEGAGDEPHRCGEIGCACLLARRLLRFREGSAVVFVCPASRIAATLRPGMNGFLLLGSHYTGALS